MRVLCRSGHFSFFPKTSNDLGFFSTFFKTQLYQENDYYTFAKLVGAPDFSVKGKPYLGLTATKTFEGKPWEVMKENGFVYDITSGLLKLKTAISIIISLPQGQYNFLATVPLIQPGSIESGSNRIMTYDGEFSETWLQLKVRQYAYA